ncbi:hypothetical protein ACYJ1Y_13245 [Natrialbaceae archaeon A-gly3]
MGVLSSDGDPVEHAPQQSDVLVHVDMAMYEDDDVERLANTMADEDPGFDGLDEEFEEFEEETGLDPTEAHEFLVFAEIPDQETRMDPDAEEFGGLIVYSDWNEDDVIESIEDEEDIDYELTEHAGEDVLYEPTEEPDFGDALYVGVLDDGQFVLGSESGVTASLDVAYDGADPVDGDVREMYDDMHGGHVTVAAGITDELEDDPTIDDEIAQAEVVGGAFDTDDGTVSLEGQVIAADENVAMDTADMIDGGLATVRQFTEDEDIENELREIEVEQDGTTVTVSYQGDIDDLEALMEMDDL